MTKKYIVTSAYTGQSKEIIGTSSNRESTSLVIHKDGVVIAIISSVGFMIEIEDFIP